MISHQVNRSPERVLAVVGEGTDSASSVPEGACPVTVKSWKVAMFDEELFAGITPVLANAFMVEGVPYRWERGRLMTPGGDPS